MAKKDNRHHAAEPSVDAGLVRPRHTVADDFEQNPLSTVSERVSIAAADSMDAEGRVREALRIVLGEGASIQDAARRCGVAPSFLREWRDKYLSFLNEQQSIARQPLMEEGRLAPDADLVRIPQAAQEMFAENWKRLVERTRATPATFQQSSVRLFLENSWLTGWLYTDGSLDRGTAWGAAVCAAAILLAGTFFAAGRFYRPNYIAPTTVDSLGEKMKAAAEAARLFFASGTLDEKFKLVYPGSRTRELMTEYYSNRALAIPDAQAGQVWPHVGIYSLEFRSESLGRNFLVNVVEKNGRMLVDWETSSLFQEVYIEELRKKRPIVPTPLSVKIERSDYYNFGFTEERYTSYRLSYPGLATDLFGYTLKGSEVDRSLAALVEPFTGGERTTAAVVEIKYPGGQPAPNQVQIVKIVQESWLKD